MAWGNVVLTENLNDVEPCLAEACIRGGHSRARDGRIHFLGIVLKLSLPEAIRP